MTLCFNVTSGLYIRMSLNVLIFYFISVLTNLPVDEIKLTLHLLQGTCT